MKIVLLCAGYGTRLINSIESDESGRYAHIKGIPKPLLPINGIPLLSHWIRAFSGCKQIYEITIVSNSTHHKSYEAIVEEGSSCIPIRIVNDGSHCNDDRSGAVNCMLLGAGDFKQDCLFIAGDTLLDKDFNLTNFIRKFKKLKADKDISCLLLSAPVNEEAVSKHGIIEVNEDGKVISFLEKPHPSETKSRLQSPCFYLVAADCMHYIEDFLEEHKFAPLSEKDATGKLISYLVAKTAVFAHHVSKRFDIGDLDSYAECCSNFQGFN